MKALMIDTFMSAGSILDIGSDTKQGMKQLHCRLKRQQPSFRIIIEPSADSMNLQSDWVSIGQDMQRSLDLFAAENNLVTSSKGEGKVCVEHSR
ncbi:hypothetical protein Q7I18_07160 [Aeromonas veronii]|uniref:hypothetical protein n=1 Tax=Aeromonas veronii TaxID=654 RepID=UPI0030052FB5